MIPGIIPVGVTVPAFSYKEGFAGSVANGGTVTITPTTAASPYRWMIISVGGGQTATSSTASIAISVNSSPIPVLPATISGDFSGPASCSDTQTVYSISTGSSFVIGFSNSLGMSMSYTIAILEIPTTSIQYVTAGVVGGVSPKGFVIPIYQGGIVLASQFGQGGTGTWADMGFTFMTKIPVASPNQEALAVLYSPVNGVLSTTLSNNASYNRIYLATTWRPA